MRSPSPETTALGDCTPPRLRPPCCHLLTTLESSRKHTVEEANVAARTQMASFAPSSSILAGGSSQRGMRLGMDAHPCTTTRIPIGWGLAREPRAVYILDKGSATELHIQLPKYSSEENLLSHCENLVTKENIRRKYDPSFPASSKVKVSIASHSSAAQC